MTTNRVNRKTEKLLWSDEDKRFLLKESKNHTVNELCEKFNRTPVAIMRMCANLGCGYRSK